MQGTPIPATAVALAIGLLALGAAAIRDAAPPVHARGTATPIAMPPPASPSKMRATPARDAPACTDAMLGPGFMRASHPQLAADCDTLLGLRYRLSRPDTLNWGDAAATLASGDGWDGVAVSGTPERVTGLTLAPYAFKDALAALARLDALVDLDLSAYATPPTPPTPATPVTPATPPTPPTPATPVTSLPAGSPICTAATLGGSRAANLRLAADCDTLLRIKSALAGTAATLDGDADGWAATRALTSWKGVAISGAPERVAALDLRDAGLDGTIATQVGNLTGLEVLALSGNALTGAIPTQIGNLTTLTVLDLHDNPFSGGIPTQIGNLTALAVLDLSDSRMRGSIPTQIGNLTALAVLDLSGLNRLRGGIPTQIGNLTALTVLDIDGGGSLEFHNQLDGSIPTQIGNLINLDDINLGINALGGSIPTQIGNLASLRHLKLWHNQFSGSIPTQIGNLANLESLRLVNNRLTGNIPTQLGSLSRLAVLRLARNQLTGSIPTQLGSLAALTSLDLGGTGLGGSIPPQLGSLARLRSIRIGDGHAGCVPDALLVLLSAANATPPATPSLPRCGDGITASVRPASP